MPPGKILIKDIRGWHPHAIPSPTDQYYHHLANRLLKTFNALNLPDDMEIDDVTRGAAIMLTNYFEDIVADSGVWHSFSQLCQEMYGHPVPLFHDEEEYFPDEPSRDAVKFIIWTVFGELTEDIICPDSHILDIMTAAAFAILDAAFEEAPVNLQLKESIETMLKDAAGGFYQMRSALGWIFMKAYLTRETSRQDLFAEAVEEFQQLADETEFGDFPFDMALYYASSICSVRYRTGHLALYPKDYLAAIMRTKDMPQPAARVAAIEALSPAMYKKENTSPLFTFKRNRAGAERLRLRRADGRLIEIDPETLNLPEENTEDLNVFFAPSFVSYHGEWNLNGIVVPLAATEKQWEESCKEHPKSPKPGQKTFTADMMLKCTGGKRLLFFADKKELKDFLAEKMRFKRETLDFIGTEYDNRPALFIDTEEPEDCLQMFYGYTQCIAEPTNPYYDKDEARHAADEILYAEGVTANAVNYMLDHNLLPDIYDSGILPQNSTPEEKRKDIDFLMRFYRRENF